MFEGVFVGIFHDVYVELAAEDHVFVHRSGSDFGNLSLCKFEEGVATRPCCLDGARDTKFRHITKLLKEIFQLSLVKAFWQMSNV